MLCGWSNCARQATFRRPDRLNGSHLATISTRKRAPLFFLRSSPLMSTSETVSFKACDCPCGAGEVTRHVTTQDNPWSSADIHLTLDCPVCAQAWQLRFEALELIESLQPYRAA